MLTDRSRIAKDFKFQFNEWITILYKQMQVIVFNNKTNQTKRYYFGEGDIFVGRSPKGSQQIVIDHQTISRTHLQLNSHDHHIYLTDLNSSNGTFLNNEIIQPMQSIELKPDDKITLATFQGFISTIAKHKKDKRKSSSSQSEEESDRSRKKTQGLPIKINKSSMKMLRDMMSENKPKADMIKFLRLMGYAKAEEYWEIIEKELRKKVNKRKHRKAEQQLEQQFNSSKAAHQKQGLGKN